MSRIGKYAGYDEPAHAARDGVPLDPSEGEPRALGSGLQGRSGTGPGPQWLPNARYSRPPCRSSRHLVKNWRQLHARSAMCFGNSPNCI